MDKGDTATFPDEADFVVDQDASPRPKHVGKRDAEFLNEWLMAYRQFDCRATHRAIDLADRDTQPRQALIVLCNAEENFLLPPVR